MDDLERNTPRFAVSDLLTAAGHLSNSELGERLGVTRRTIQRWKREQLDEWRADRWATAIGLHPADVWPSWEDAAPRIAPGGGGHGRIRRRGDSYEVHVYLPRRLYGQRRYVTTSVADLHDAERLLREGIERAARGETVVLPQPGHHPRWRGVVRRRGSSWQVRVYLGRDDDGRKRYFTRTVSDERAARCLHAGVMIELEASGASGRRALAIARRVEARLRRPR